MNHQISIYIFLGFLLLLVFIYWKNIKLKKESKKLRESLGSSNEEISLLKDKVEDFEEKYSPILDMEKAVQQQVERLDREREKTFDEINNRNMQLLEIDNKISAHKEQYRENLAIYKRLMSQISIYNEDLEMIEIGITPLVFKYEDSESYKKALTEINDKQKLMAKEKTIIQKGSEWTVNGSKAEGRKFMNQASRLAARAFNNEANNIIKNVSWRNYETSASRMEKSFSDINKFNASNNIKITNSYLNLKLEELRLTYEYQLKIQQEKEDLAEAKRLIREEENLKRDQEKAQKEEEKYEKLLEKARREAESKAGSDLEKLNEQIAHLAKQLEEAHNANQRAMSMAQQTRSGFVYIISNIGSFGENIYKIGMTRRLEPMDRVRELSGASVPFIFDTHAMIYSSDAPTLESKLHNRFTENRVNMANFRKEYFKVSLDEIEKEVASLGIDYEFFRTPEAEEYRKTQAMKKQLALKKEEVSEAFPESI